jgi:excisionase family DNA binding protein
MPHEQETGQPDPHELLTIEEAAETIGVSRQYINALIKRKRLLARRVQLHNLVLWEIRREDLDYYVAERAWMRSDRPLPEDYVSSLPDQVLAEIERRRQAGRADPRR